MKKTGLRLIAMALILCFTVAIASCGSLASTEDETDAYAYIAIDINPSVELIVNEDEVIKVRALNDDALVLLSGEEIEGLTVEDATKKIVELADELGYLSEENNNVKLTVSADDEELVATVEEQAQEGAKRGSSKAVVSRNPRSANQRTVKELKEKNPELFEKIDAAKVHIIEAIMEFDSEMTYEAGAQMTISELVDMLKALTEKAEAGISEELKEKMDARHKELKEEAKRQMAEVYGEEYLEKWEKHHALEDILNKIEEKVEGLTLSEEDVNTILNLLGLQSAEEISQNGEITVKDIQKYIDKNLDSEALEAIEEELNAIIDKYSKKEYKLNEEELDKIKDTFGEDMTLKSLADLDKLVEENKEKINELKENTELTQEQKESLEKIKGSIDEFSNKVREEFQREIEDVKKEIDNIKEGKMGR